MTYFRVQSHHSVGEGLGETLGWMVTWPRCKLSIPKYKSRALLLHQPSQCILPENWKSKIQNSIIWSVFLNGWETWPLTLMGSIEQSAGSKKDGACIFEFSGRMTINNELQRNQLWPILKFYPIMASERQVL
jgi:hypothetical protein